MRPIALLLWGLTLLAPVGVRAESTPQAPSSVSSEREPSLTQISIGASVRHFDYLEGDGAGDSETGTMPGIELGIEHRFPDSPLFFKAIFDGLDSHAIYNGSDQAGTVPITLKDYTQLLDVEADLGLILSRSAGSTWRAYAGLGYHYWRRGDGGTTNGVTDYREDYSWLVLPIGARWDQELGRRFRLSLDMAALVTFSCRLKVYWSQVDPSSSDLNLSPGTEMGYRFQLPLNYLMSRATSLGLTPWLEYTALGRSEPIRGMLEPSSRTYQYGSTFALIFAM